MEEPSYRNRPGAISNLNKVCVMGTKQQYNIIAGYIMTT